MLYRDYVMEEAARKSLRSAVVDDEMGIQMLINELLRSLGFKSEATDDGAELLKRHEESPYDIVITDWIMPKMPGKEVVESLVQTSSPPRIIVMTGEPNVSLDANAVIDGFLFKPFSADDAIKCIAKVLGDEDA